MIVSNSRLATDQDEPLPVGIVPGLDYIVEVIDTRGVTRVGYIVPCEVHDSYDAFSLTDYLGTCDNRLAAQNVVVSYLVLGQILLSRN